MVILENPHLLKTALKHLFVTEAKENRAHTYWTQDYRVRKWLEQWSASVLSVSGSLQGDNQAQRKWPPTLFCWGIIRKYSYYREHSPSKYMFNNCYQNKMPLWCHSPLWYVILMITALKEVGIWMKHCEWKRLFEFLNRPNFYFPEKETLMFLYTRIHKRFRHIFSWFQHR